MYSNLSSSSASREGIPRVLLEAASMGLPIIIADSPGCRQVVENNVNGFLVPPMMRLVLSQAISYLIEARFAAELWTDFSSTGSRMLRCIGNCRTDKFVV